jgi:CPA1 family monovalent cation:H+ antiporter
LTTVIAIVARFLWVFPAIYLPRWVSPSLAKRDPSPRWQAPFFLAFAGLRGVDSLAVALAIPYTILSGEPFPHRDLILFVTFGVIIITLVGQGALLPMVVRWLGLNKLARHEREHEIQAELKARASALDEVEKKLDKLINERELPDEVIELLRTRNQSRSQILPDNLQDSLEQIRLTASVKKELIDAEREFIYQLLRDGKITDEARRRIEYELDLEEASVANRGQAGGGWI